MKLLSHLDLQNDCGRVLREAEAGERFIVTVDGCPVATLGPPESPRFVRKCEYLPILRQQAADPDFFDDIASMDRGPDEMSDPSER